jgi:N-acetylmuramoyl-L-alanine amidase
MLKIQNHRLVGPNVAFRATPNVGGALTPKYLVLHYTAGSSAKSSIESLCTKKPQGNASAHIVLARDGTITQLAPFNVITWHAGVSQWNGIEGLNPHSIGIEIDNAGPMNQVGDQFIAWFGKAYPATEVMMAAHKHGGPVRPWHAYTAVQIERCLELAEALVQHYGLQDILGHDDIARGRKQDPGPAFPMASIAGRALGRGDDHAVRYVITTAGTNIRGGPGANFATVAPALKKGTVVLLLEPSDRWSKVEVEGATEVEGWVHNSLMVQLADAPRGVVPRGRGAAPAQATVQLTAKAAKVAKGAPKQAAKKGWLPNRHAPSLAKAQRKSERAEPS